MKERGDDSWLWRLENNGLYSVKTAYNEIMKTGGVIEDKYYKRVWNNFIPPKVDAFLWSLSIDRIPTLENLAKRGIVQKADASCQGSRVHLESSSYLFFGCNHFNYVWYDCLNWVGFMGIPVCNSKVRQKWQVIWFAGQSG